MDHVPPDARDGPDDGGSSGKRHVDGNRRRWSLVGCSGNQASDREVRLRSADRRAIPAGASLSPVRRPDTDSRSPPAVTDTSILSANPHCSSPSSSTGSESTTSSRPEDRLIPETPAQERPDRKANEVLELAQVHECSVYRCERLRQESERRRQSWLRAPEGTRRGSPGRNSTASAPSAPR